MSYLVTQMWMCLLAAGLLGFVLGWLLKQLGLGSKLEELETSWKSRLAGVEGERDKLRANAAELTAQSRKVETDWTAKYGALSGDHDKLKLSLIEVDKKYAGFDADWKAKWAALETEKKKLASEHEGCSAKVAAAEKDLAAWKLQFADLEKTAETAKADHDSLNAKLAAGTAALAAAEAARIALGNDSRKLSAELEAEKAKHAAREADWKSKWAMHDKELGSWKLKFADLQKAGSGAKADHDSLSAKFAAGAAALAAAEAARHALSNDAKKLADQLEQEKGKYSHLDTDWRAKWAILEKERNQLKADIDLKAKHEHEVHEKHQEAEAHWKSRWVALEKERDSLKAQLEAAGKNDGTIHAQLQDAQAKLGASDADWTGRIATLEAELDKLRNAKPAVLGDIEDIEGIGPSYGDKLRGVGIAWIKQLLERGANKEGRDEIAASSGIAYPLILKWTNIADLLRLRGVTPDWAELLEASGVDTVKEIKQRVPGNLLTKMTEVNAEKHLAPSLPTIELVTSWVEQAKAIPPILTY